MPQKLNEPWNYSITYLEFFYNDQSLASGSGFFWNTRSKQLILVSNWHNFSGRNPDTLKLLDPHASIPNKLKFKLYRKTSEQDEDGNYEISVITETISLKDDRTETNFWYEHPTLSHKVDIAAINITNFNDDKNWLHAANNLESDIVRPFYVAQDAFIVGYPLGLLCQNPPIPIWKRGSLATEPNINPDGRQIIYVDSATRSGMSGSIVLTRDLVSGNYLRKDGTKSNTLIAYPTQIVGIYSARMGNDELQAQLGIVWKRNLIDEVANSGKFAKYI